MKCPNEQCHYFSNVNSSKCYMCGVKDFKENLPCPFCSDGDFDLIGLKSHLEHGDCEPYNQTLTVQRIF
jgi:hypothetical protein